MKPAFIHPKAHIWGEVEVGKDTIIEPFCVIHGPVVIGEGNLIQSGTIIGCPAEHRSKDTGLSVSIGNNNIIGPNSVITGATDIRPTQIGDGNILMSGVHISHDCIVGNNTTISHKVIIAGECHILDGVNMGSGSMAHQGSVIGAYAGYGWKQDLNEDEKLFKNLLETNTDDILEIVKRFHELSGKRGRDKIIYFSGLIREEEE